MSDRDALLAAIRARPAEDVPRLMFADWLDEHGTGTEREWAAFIRDDIAHRAMDDYAPARLRWELIEKPLREGAPWVQEWFANHTGDEFEPLLSRGFPWLVPTSAEELAAREPELAGVVPRPVYLLSEQSLAIARAFGSPHLARASGLRLRNTLLTPHQALALGNAPHAAALIEVDAINGGIQFNAVQVLLRSDLFPQLELLALGDSGYLGEECARILAEARESNLDALMLNDAGRIEPDALAGLFASPVGRGLRRLMLDSCAIGREGAAEFGSASALTELVLPNAGIGRAGFAALLVSPLIGQLRALDASANGLDAFALEALAEHPGASALRALCLADNTIGDAGAAVLLRSPHLAGLLVLDLSYCMVGDEAIEALLESPLCETLVLLTLQGSPASAEAKAALAARMGDRVRV